MTGFDFKTGYDIEAEQAVLGAILMASSNLTAVTVDERVTADDFGRKTHRAVFAAMLELGDANEPIDVLSVARKAQVEPSMVDALAGCVPAAGNARHYARLVKRASLRRSWVAAASSLMEAAQTDDERLVAQAEQHLASPTISDDTFDQEKLAAAVDEFFDESNPGGITTGFAVLDDIIGNGFRPGDTTVLGGWENMGKTPLLDQWLAQAAANGLRAHAYINEMSAQDRALRMIAHMGAAPLNRIMARSLDERQAQRVLKAQQNLPFAVTDVSQWSAEQIGRHIRANRWDLCGLDVLHNMPYADERELSQIVVTLANAARSAGSHLIIVAHLNQERAKTEALPRPVRRDLRGTGMLAKVASQVVFLHREQHTSNGFVETDHVAAIYADKAKHGRPGEGIETVFEWQHMRFRLPTGLELQSGVAA